MKHKALFANNEEKGELLTKQDIMNAIKEIEKHDKYLYRNLYRNSSSKTDNFKLLNNWRVLARVKSQLHLDFWKSFKELCKKFNEKKGEK
jgi:hypothetical protein